MRDKRFVAEYRGGTLKIEQHRQLIRWAYSCVEHVLPLLDGKLDNRLLFAISVAKEWEKGNATVNDARNAAFKAIALVNESSDSTLVAIARAAGQAVATAHMSDHSLGAALYALKAVKIAGKSVHEEKEWQNKQIPSDVKDLVLSTMTIKEKGLKI